MADILVPLVTPLGLMGLWLVDPAHLPDDAEVRMLDDAERAWVARLVNPCDRSTFLATHLGLRAVLATLMGCAPDTFRFAATACPLCGTPHGRPRLDPGVDGIHFSLAHTCGLGLIGVASDQVGVDIQAVPNADDTAVVAFQLHPDEHREMRDARPDRLRHAFGDLWVRKEAFLKGLGTGLGRPMRADYLGVGSPDAWPQGWSIANITTRARFATAYAVRTPGVWS